MGRTIPFSETPSSHLTHVSNDLSLTPMVADSTSVEHLVLCWRCDEQVAVNKLLADPIMGGFPEDPLRICVDCHYDRTQLLVSRRRD